MKLEEIPQISIQVEENLPIGSLPPLLQRLSLKVRQLVFKYLPPKSTPELQFKTTVALLLNREEIRTFFLQDPERRKDFYHALQQAARECGWETFTPPQEKDPLEISRALTRLSGQSVSLIDDQDLLAHQCAALKPQNRQNILCSIFDRLERPPVHSVVEVKGATTHQSIPLTTQYAQYKIIQYDSDSGHITYDYHINHATSSIRTASNSLPDGKGTMNQHVVRSTDTGSWIGSYCGELSTPFHVLEQILLISGQTSGEASIVQHLPNNVTVFDLPILFTSLYSWHEFSLISDQKAAVRAWDQKILLSEGHYFRLNLLHYNIPFNGLHRFPKPAEIKAAMRDMNDEAWIVLTASFFRYLRTDAGIITEIAARVESLRTLDDSHFIEREKALLDEIDTFRAHLPKLIATLESMEQTPFVQALKALYNGHFTGIDQLLYLDYAVKKVGYFHNKNSRNATDRCAGADSADKAQYAFQTLEKTPFLPESATEEEQKLFKKLYSMYLLKEEPEINAAFSTGFRDHVHKNPELRHYLIH